MLCERFALRGDPATFARDLRGLVPPMLSVHDDVAEIIARVRDEGDAAVLQYTRRFDTADTDLPGLVVAAADLDAAAKRLGGAVRQGLERTIVNVRRVAEAGLHEDQPVVFEGHEVILHEVPVGRAGIYVPGGRAPYPSSAVMGVVSARAAEVAEVAVCAPPGRDGEIDQAVLAACRLAGATRVYRMGGAQAIAALAYGTESVAAVDVIAGPGNLYVQEAKRQVSDRVGTDSFAGPSDLLVIADAGSDPALVALDLLAQAEHGPGTLVIAVSSSMELLDELGARLADGPDSGAVACLVEVGGSGEALALAQAFAPEHLQLVGRSAEALASKVTHAGCVFVGPGSGTAFGDYIAGSNHVLPTGGAARFASALSPAHFRRRFSEVRLGDGAGELAREAAPVARAEGFELHARSMEARIRDNGRDDA